MLGLLAGRVDAEALVAEARSRLGEVYQRFLQELEQDARRLVEDKMRKLEPVKREIVEALRV